MFIRIRCSAKMLYTYSTSDYDRNQEHTYYITRYVLNLSIDFTQSNCSDFVRYSWEALSQIGQFSFEQGRIPALRGHSCHRVRIVTTRNRLGLCRVSLSVADPGGRSGTSGRRW